METQVITDSSGFALIESLPATRCRLQVETKGFDEYMVDVTIKAGEITTVAAHLEPIEELPFERLSDEQAQKFIRACSQPEFWKVEHKRFSFENEQQWITLWSELKLAAPPVDFKKWRVLALIRRTSDSGAEAKIRRITYNPKRKIIRVLHDFPSPNLVVRLQVVSCNAEFVLIPPRTGEVIFH